MFLTVKKYPQSFVYIHKLADFKTAAVPQQDTFMSDAGKVLSLASVETDEERRVLSRKCQIKDDLYSNAIFLTFIPQENTSC